jgi:hypothetical protein
MQSFDYIVGASAISVGFAGYFVYFAGISPTAQNVTIIVAVAMPLVLTRMEIFPIINHFSLKVFQECSQVQH